MKVAVAGALGRMGRLAVETVRNAPDCEYAGGFARAADARENVYDDVEELIARTSPDVILDFTVRPATQQVARAAVEAGVVPIVGSSEWNDAERDELRALCERKNASALLVPNFAIGAVLMMRFAGDAAPYFPNVEIVEMHRAEKRDRPSGTASATAERIRRSGGPGEVPIHSVRLRGVLAHQVVLFGNEGELLTIRHDSLSRDSYAAGILLAIRNARTLSGMHVGLESVLP